MNLYKICLRVKKRVLCKSNISYNNPKYVWLLSENLINAATWTKKALESKYSDYYLEDIRPIGKVETDD